MLSQAYEQPALYFLQVPGLGLREPTYNDKFIGYAARYIDFCLAVLISIDRFIFSSIYRDVMSSVALFLLDL